MVLALALLAAALFRWWQIAQELERMNSRLEEATRAQQALRRRLQETQKLLHQQMVRLRRMEAQRTHDRPPPKKEAEP